MRFSWLCLGKHSTQDLLCMAQECEAAGFETFYFADERFYMETYSSLTLCATLTRKIGLGPGVTDPYSRHPALTAMAIGTLDHFSDGRAVLGLGAGSSGFKQLGIKRVHPAQAVREAVQVIRGLLAGERVTLEGQVFRIKEAQLNFAPRGPVPIIVASNGQLIVQVAGEVGDGLISSSVLTEPRLSEVREYLERGLARAGRKRSQLSVWSRLNIAVHPERRVAYDALKPNVYYVLCGKYPDTTMFDGKGGALPDDLRRAVETVGWTRDPQVLALVAPLVPDEFVDRTCLVGTPTHVIEQLRKLQGEGIDGVLLFPAPVGDQSTLDLIHLVTREIMPALRSDLSQGG